MEKKCDLNCIPSGNLSIICAALPVISPLFATTILYFIITVAPLSFLELISIFANLSGSSVGTVLNVATIGISSNDKAVEDENVTNNTSQAQVTTYSNCSYI